MEKNIYYYETKIGKIGIGEENKKITDVFFNEGAVSGKVFESELIKKAALQIQEYLEGNLKKFDLPLEIGGSEFSKKVYEALLQIPYGKTCSYKEIATQIGNEKASRAVGNANNKNPISIIVPCHRVIGKNGSLTGYAGGLDIKRVLLDLERKEK